LEEAVDRLLIKFAASLFFVNLDEKWLIDEFSVSFLAFDLLSFQAKNNPTLPNT
jgi:hypothetical protein